LQGKDLIFPSEVAERAKRPCGGAHSLFLQQCFCCESWAAEHQFVDPRGGSKKIENRLLNSISTIQARVFGDKFGQQKQRSSRICF